MDKFEKFQKTDKDSYSSINDFLKKRSLLTTREWMVSEIINNFRKEGTGTIPMTEVGKKLPSIFPFINKKYEASEISNAKNSFERKVTRSGTTFLYALKKGVIKEEKLEEIITEIATNIREINEVLDEDPSEEILKELPNDLKEVIKKINDIEDGEDVKLNEPIFGEYKRGELGEKWREKVKSKEHGELVIELVFDRPLSSDDILVPEEVDEKNCFLDLEKGYGYRDNGRYIERYSIKILKRTS